MKFAVVHNIQNMLEFVCMSVKPTFTHQNDQTQKEDINVKI